MKVISFVSKGKVNHYCQLLLFAKFLLFGFQGRVFYEMTGNLQAPSYFAVNNATGVISIIRNLTDDVAETYQVSVCVHACMCVYIYTYMYMCACVMRQGEQDDLSHFVKGLFLSCAVPDDYIEIILLATSKSGLWFT